VVVPALDGADDCGAIARVLLPVQEVQYRLSIQSHGIIQVCCLGTDLRHRDTNRGSERLGQHVPPSGRGTVKKRREGKE
jgi:hypothetical protein